MSKELYIKASGKELPPQTLETPVPRRTLPPSCTFPFIFHSSTAIRCSEDSEYTSSAQLEQRQVTIDKTTQAKAKQWDLTTCSTGMSQATVLITVLGKSILASDVFILITYFYCCFHPPFLLIVLVPWKWLSVSFWTEKGSKPLLIVFYLLLQTIGHCKMTNLSI